MRSPVEQGKAREHITITRKMKGLAVMREGSLRLAQRRQQTRDGMPGGPMQLLHCARNALQSARARIPDLLQPLHADRHRRLQLLREQPHP